MRTTTAVSISLPPAELKRAQRLAKQTNRSLSGVFREGLKRLQDQPAAAGRRAGEEYTPAQQRFIDARVAEGLDDFRKGRVHGPFASAKEAGVYIERVANERAATRRARRPVR
jgi:predicted transcriptional regulator